MASLNKVFLMGNLTRDPELRYTPSGSAVTDLPLAINRAWTGKDGDRKEDVLYIDVTVWDRQAEHCCQYLKKGRGVHVEGSLKMESWDDKATGEKKSKIKVLADRVQFLDRREDGGPGPDGDSAPAARRSSGGYNSNGGSGGRGGNTYQPAQSQPSRRPTAPPPPAANESGDEEEDIPF